MDIFPFDNYHTAIKTASQKEQLEQDIALAHKMIPWDWKNRLDFWPDEIPSETMPYSERRRIQNEIVMKNKKASKNGTIYRGCETYFSPDAKRLYSPDSIFPLRLAKFDGKDFYIPNKYQQILEISYGDIYAWPRDMFPHHALLSKATVTQLSEINNLLKHSIKDIIKDIKQ